MPPLRSLFASIVQYVFGHLARSGRIRWPLPSRFADIFYGVFMSAVLVALVDPTPERAGFDPPSLAPLSVEEAVERFAPEVRFHPQERYFPSSVDWFLERASVDPEGDQQGLVATNAPEQLDTTVLPAVFGAEDRQKTPVANPAHLSIDPEADVERVRRGELDSAETYVHLRPAADSSSGYDIQYWFFYPYSGPLMEGPAGGAHEGDWEHITVRTDRARRDIEAIFFAAHDNEGRWLEPSEVRFRDGTHPVVYVARYGHASYPTPDLHSRGMLPADRTADGGRRWKTWESLEVVAHDGEPVEGHEWLAFPGRWGQEGVLFSGPQSPLFQEYWSGR